MGLKKPPLVYTEQGVAMLSSVLNSERAIMVNIQIMRVFTKKRELVETHKEILHKLEQLEKATKVRQSQLFLRPEQCSYSSHYHFYLLKLAE